MSNDVFYLPPDDPDLDREYITGEEFQRGTKTAVRTLSSDFDTDVVFAGEQAKTDGKQVVLPLTDADKMMTHRQVEVGTWLCQSRNTTQVAYRLQCRSSLDARYDTERS